MKKLRSGLALLSALVTAALVAALAAQSLGYRWRLLEDEQAMRQISQRQWLMRSALDWAAQGLREDALRSPAVDHLGEPWAQPVRDLALEPWLASLGSPVQAAATDAVTGSVRLTLSISDAQARLNLLNLLEGPGLSPVWLASFTRLFTQLGLPSQELDLLTQSLLRASAGTDTNSPGPAPLMPQRADDLPWLGLSPASVAALRPHVVVLPGRLPVNLNTAGPAVLQAVLDLPPTAIAALIERRQSQPMRILADSGLNERVDESRHTVATQFFEVAVRLESSQWALQGRALLLRQGNTVRTLWRI
jgi:general secretion pathway protein K